MGNDLSLSSPLLPAAAPPKPRKIVVRDPLGRAVATVVSSPAETWSDLCFRTSIEQLRRPSRILPLLVRLRPDVRLSAYRLRYDGGKAVVILPRWREEGGINGDVPTEEGYLDANVSLRPCGCGGDWDDDDGDAEKGASNLPPFAPHEAVLSTLSASRSDDTTFVEVRYQTLFGDDGGGGGASSPSPFPVARDKTRVLVCEEREGLPGCADERRCEEGGEGCDLPKRCANVICRARDEEPTDVDVESAAAANGAAEKDGGEGATEEAEDVRGTEGKSSEAGEAKGVGETEGERPRETDDGQRKRKRSDDDVSGGPRKVAVRKTVGQVLAEVSAEMTAASTARDEVMTSNAATRRGSVRGGSAPSNAPSAKSAATNFKPLARRGKALPPPAPAAGGEDGAENGSKEAAVEPKADSDGGARAAAKATANASADGARREGGAGAKEAKAGGGAGGRTGGEARPTKRAPRSKGPPSAADVATAPPPRTKATAGSDGSADAKADAGASAAVEAADRKSRGKKAAQSKRPPSSTDVETAPPPRTKAKAGSNASAEADAGASAAVEAADRKSRGDAADEEGAQSGGDAKQQTDGEVRQKKKKAASSKAAGHGNQEDAADEEGARSGGGAKGQTDGEMQRKKKAVSPKKPSPVATDVESSPRQKKKKSSAKEASEPGENERSEKSTDESTVPGGNKRQKGEQKQKGNAKKAGKKVDGTSQEQQSERKQKRNAEEASKKSTEDGTSEKLPDPKPKKQKSQQNKKSNGKSRKKAAADAQEEAAKEFPSGWTQQRIRRANSDREDLVFYSPGEEYKFRSRADVKRFLEKLDEWNGDEKAAFALFKKGQKGAKKAVSVGKTTGDEQGGKEKGTKKAKMYGKRKRSANPTAEALNVLESDGPGVDGDAPKKKSKPTKKSTDGKTDEDRADTGESEEPPIASGGTKPAGKKRSPKKKKAVDPVMPKRPPNAYFLWIKDVRPKLKREHPDLKPTEFTAKLGEVYRSQSEKQLKSYQEKAAEDLKRYQDAVVAYKKTLSQP
ncbi:hypothetical protein ACHAWF_011869 [Thalassiosira exigua]